MLSIISWGKFFPDYALLLYDDSDMAQYIQQFFPGVYCSLVLTRYNTLHLMCMALRMLAGPLCLVL